MYFFIVSSFQTFQLNFPNYILCAIFIELKENGSARRIKYALEKFGSIIKLIRPSKCQTYLVTCLPSLLKILEREEDQVQNIIQDSFPRIIRQLLPYGAEQEIQNVSWL